jgi:hypothetical protein
MPAGAPRLSRHGRFRIYISEAAVKSTLTPKTARLSHLHAIVEEKGPQMPAVLVYRSDLLPFSETFIKEQFVALRRWRGILVGQRRLCELPLDGIDIRILRADQPFFRTTPLENKRSAHQIYCCQTTRKFRLLDYRSGNRRRA